MNYTQLEETFKCLDKDNSGYIELEELKIGLKLVYSVNDNSVDDIITDIFTFIDGFGLFNSKDHRLNKNELHKIWKKIPKQPTKGKQGLCELLFDIIDMDGNGTIEESEFRLYLKRVENTTLKSKEITNLFVKLQTEIGKINREKFIEYITELN